MTVLALQNLNKAFGGLQATNDVSITVNEGERVGIIGPNGAGKTTIFNQISGYIIPDTGTITFMGRNITGYTPHKLVRMGIGRAFQRSNIFPRLTAYENVQAAVMSQYQRQFNLWQASATHADVGQRTSYLLDIIGLSDKQRERMAGKLALGDQKRLEIGLALALEPQLLLLDEPTAGMSPQETENTVKLVDEVAKQFNMSMLFTEHDMEVVFGIAERIYVLHQGTIIAEGTPQEVSDNVRVQEVYLGTDIHASA